MNRYLVGDLTSHTKAPPPRFKYINCIDPENGYENTQHKITAITFHISRYRLYKHTLTFLFPLTIKGAIEKAEEYLSQPLTREYYDRIQEDLFHNEDDYETAIKWRKNRGDCLTDAFFLEKIEQPDPEVYHIHLRCGS